MVWVLDVTLSVGEENVVKRSSRDLCEGVCVHGDRKDLIWAMGIRTKERNSMVYLDIKGVRWGRVRNENSMGST